MSFNDTRYLDITTLDKEVEKSVSKVGGESAHHPGVKEGNVGDLEINNKDNNTASYFYTQNIAKTRLQRKRAKLVDGWIGGRRSSWFT